MPSRRSTFSRFLSTEVAIVKSLRYFPRRDGWTGQGGEQVGCRHRGRDEVALEQVAPVAGQEVALLRAFHSFGDHAQPEVVGELDDAAHDGPAVGLAGQ